VPTTWARSRDLASGTFSPGRGRWRDSVGWQVAVGVAGVAAGVVAVWVTLPADFLRYPAWLAAQNADFVIGPVLTGLYWIRRRPQSPFGPMLICWGLVGALYILQSSSDSWLFSVGLFWEKVFGLGTYVLILAFPTGRLDRPSKVLLAVGVVTVLLLAVAIQLVQPQVGAGGSISSCRSLCPHNELAFTSDLGLALDLFEVFSYAVLALAVAVAAVVIHRFITGTPPRRRALVIGTPSPCCSCCARCSISCLRSRAPMTASCTASSSGCSWPPVRPSGTASCSR
jgi:hypothetical protein